MKIGINALFSIPGRVGGSEIYLRRLLAALSGIDGKNEYIIFTNRENRSTFQFGGNFREHNCSLRGWNRPHRVLYEQIMLPYWAGKYRLNVLHSPGSSSPLISPCPTVVTILDLIYLHFPETFPRFARLGIKFLVSQSARRSSAVIALSRYSRDQMMWDLDMPGDKIRVIYMGVSETGAGAIPRPERVKVLRKYGIVLPFILAVAAAHPHKNLLRLLEAFFRLKTMKGRSQLVIVGVKHSRYYQRLEKTLSRLELAGDVIFTDWVPERDKEIIYSEALLMVFPSLLEGFGLPILEAMKSGVPVICSDVPSLEEAAGDAAYIFNPYSAEDIANAMQACLSRPELQKELVRRGKIQAEQFSWEKTARETLALYEELCEGG